METKDLIKKEFPNLSGIDDVKVSDMMKKIACCAAALGDIHGTVSAVSYEMHNKEVNTAYPDFEKAWNELCDQLQIISGEVAFYNLRESFFTEI